LLETKELQHAAIVVNIGIDQDKEGGALVLLGGRGKALADLGQVLVGFSDEEET
jgi:hypothetical protein